MAPEYAIDGLFSVKSDAYSFGVVVLEIVSGKKIRGSCHSENNLSLLGHVSAKNSILYPTFIYCMVSSCWYNHFKLHRHGNFIKRTKFWILLMRHLWSHAISQKFYEWSKLGYYVCNHIQKTDRICDLLFQCWVMTMSYLNQNSNLVFSLRGECKTQILHQATRDHFYLMINCLLHFLPLDSAL